MDPTTLLALLILCFMFLLLAVGMPIGFAMGLSAFIGTLLLIDGQAALALLGQTAYDTTVTYNLSLIPMFVLMGYLAGEARLSESLYRACNAWLGHRRGGLALATIGGCGAFAARVRDDGFDPVVQRRALVTQSTCEVVAGAGRKESERC